jgi:transposase
MRPFGTSQQLAGRRQRALRLLRNGQTPAVVAKRVGATAQSVRRWWRERRQSKHKAHRSPGRPSYLSESQCQHLLRTLKRGAYANGYAQDYWTLDRIAHVIWELFGVRYHPSSVWHLLQRLGWSCQRPQRRTFARDEQAIAHWKRYTWPQIKKVAHAQSDLAFCR